MTKKVLIVDDNADNRELIERALKKLELQLYFAPDGMEALEQVKACNPDLVILDIMMPGMTGYQVCEQIKSNTSLWKGLVMFVSARHGLTAMNTAKACGGDDYMEKPITPKALRNRVSILLGL